MPRDLQNLREWQRRNRLKNGDKILAQQRLRNTSYRKEHIAKGICSEPFCNRKAAKDRRLCKICSDVRQKRRDLKIKRGFCRRCLIRKATLPMTSCKSCRELVRANTLFLKILTAWVYGGKCSCLSCNESNVKFLTLDHINNDGAKHRKTIASNLWWWAWKNDFPSTLRLLCWNCNCARAQNDGICPHEED